MDKTGERNEAREKESLGLVLALEGSKLTSGLLGLGRFSSFGGHCVVFNILVRRGRVLVRGPFIAPLEARAIRRIETLRASCIFPF